MAATERTFHLSTGISRPLMDCEAVTEIQMLLHAPLAITNVIPYNHTERGAGRWQKF